MAQTLLQRLGLKIQEDGSRYPTWASSRLYAVCCVLLAVMLVLKVVDGLDRIGDWFIVVGGTIAVLALAASARDLRRWGR